MFTINLVAHQPLEEEMPLDHEALRLACYDVAKATMLVQKPVDAALLDSLATRLYEIAVSHEGFVESQGRDPNLLVRATKYLRVVHAIPPMADDTSWFDDMLTCLVELTCPNSGVTKEQESFFQDIEAGLDVARSDYS